MGTRRLHQPTVNKRWVKTGFGINARHHRRGGGFAVRTGDGNAMAIAHQLGQHFCPLDHRNARLTGCDDLRVVCRDSGRHHYHAGIQHVFRAVMKVNRCPKLAQLLGDRVRCQVGTADLITLVGQHLGDTTHAGTTDANKVNVPDASHLGHEST
ncbi:hypothetical protein D3C79_681780 [compost metagenome]